MFRRQETPGNTLLKWKDPPVRVDCDEAARILSIIENFRTVIWDCVVMVKCGVFLNFIVRMGGDNLPIGPQKLQ